MRRLSGFTLIELMVAVAIIGILAAVITSVFATQQANGRDANRRDSLRGYQAALEQYRLAKGTYFVYAGTVSSASVSPDPKGRMENLTDPLATGTEGGGWGGLSFANPNTPSISLASVLQQDGYLATIQSDPSHSSSNSNDYQLNLCQSAATPILATSPANAMEYSLVAKLEGTNSDVTTNDTGICDGAYKVLTTLGTTAIHTFAVSSRRW